MSLAKIKKMFSITLIPRILRDEVTLSPRKLGKRPLDGFWKMAKSTDSKDREAECEKCKKLIEMVFGPQKPDSLVKQMETKMEDIRMDNIQKVIAPTIAVNEKFNESNKVGSASSLSTDNTKKGLEYVEKKSNKNIDVLSIENPLDQGALDKDNILQSTTAKTNEEQLAQKLETIEEPGLVEATSPKVEGFNTYPKVLGDQVNTLDSKNSLCSNIGSEDNVMDEIAKKCLGTPPDKIDERILEEMKSCGMLGRGRKKPTSRSGYHTIKSDEKESFLQTKSEQTSLYFKNQQKPNSSLQNYHNNLKFANNRQNLYSADFKNVPLDLFRNPQLDKNTHRRKTTVSKQTEEKNILQEEKTNKASSRNFVDTHIKNPIVNNLNFNKEDMPKEMLMKLNTNKDEKPKEIIENVEGEIEKVHLSVVETSRLGIPEETEMDPDIDNKHEKPEILHYNHVLRKTNPPMEHRLFETGKADHVAFSNTKQPKNFSFAQDISDRPFNNPNTAISGTYSYPQADEEKLIQEAINDTAISSKQNPAEYYDLSHCNTGKFNDEYVRSLSTVRFLAAYHQYTIISGTDEADESQNVLFYTKNQREVPTTDQIGKQDEAEETQNVLFYTNDQREIPTTDKSEKQEPSRTINKGISATMGPLPQVKDMEEELSLTEMLRRVRERNRLQYCREYAFKALEAEPAEANKCPPPLDKGPSKTLGPGPCKPKPKPACPPPPPTCPPPSPCKPKDPCAKFTKTCLIGDKIKETFSLVLQVTMKSTRESRNFANIHQMNTVEPLKHVLYSKDVHQIEKLASFLLGSYAERKTKGSSNDDVILARDYEPWSPIPSWPIPKKEEKVPFVCPKEGCKIIPPPRLNPPCKENPCINLPKRSFSLVDFEYDPLYLYETY